MLPLRIGVPRRIARVATPCVVMVIGLVLAGCASDEEYRRQAYAQSQAYMAMNGPQPPQRKEELEDDGLPSQVAPLRDRRQEPDDPSEPFSRNYGKPPATPASAPASDPAPVPPAIPSAPAAASRHASAGIRRIDDAYRPPVAGWSQVAAQR